ncbi:MAG: DUF4384 domain-containing protein [Proteobacteria bacterium]|nr:DUF4384 domain-containing protein [Pseudomonadota bacterium]
MLFARRSAHAGSKSRRTAPQGRSGMPGAFSSEVDTGSRQESASKQESGTPFRFYRNGNGSRIIATIVLALALGCAGAKAARSPATSGPDGIKLAPPPPFMRLSQAAKPPIALPNSARIAIKMTPDKSVPIGSKVEFEITSARRGYVLLVDIDATGKMTQFFPNPELLEHLRGDDINLIQANGRLNVPSDATSKYGFSYITTGPTGSSAIVAILSQRKVQLVDLPDAVGTESATASVTRLLKWFGELRVADPDSGKLLPSEWSYDFKIYEIR